MAPERTPSFAFQVARPEAGQQVILQADPASKGLALNFPADAAQLERQGDNLVFSFSDGGSVVIENFYQAYTKDNVPDFSVDGLVVAGADFFAALDENLAPAAGPAATAAQNGGRFYNNADMSLLGGIDALGGLDNTYSRTADPTNDPIPTGLGAAGPVEVATATTTPGNDAGTGGDIGSGGGNTGGGSGSTDTGGNKGPSFDASQSVVTLGLRDANAVGDAQSTDDATLHFNAGNSAITGYVFGNAIPVINGLAPKVELQWRVSADGTTLEGVYAGTNTIAITLTLSSTDPATGDVTIQATLNDPMLHAEGVNSLSVSGLQVKAVDGNGNMSDPADVTITVADDGPTISNADSDYQNVGSSHFTGVLDFDFGADTGSGRSLIVDGVEGKLENGVWEFKLESGASLSIDDATHKFDYTAATGGVKLNTNLSVTIRDADGDMKGGTITLHVVKSEHGKVGQDLSSADAVRESASNFVQGSDATNNLLFGETPGGNYSSYSTKTLNLCVVLDLTNSMDWDFNGIKVGEAGFNSDAVRSDALHAQVQSLFESLQNQTGDVNVRVITFSGSKTWHYNVTFGENGYSIEQIEITYDVKTNTYPEKSLGIVSFDKLVTPVLGDTDFVAAMQYAGGWFKDASKAAGDKEYVNKMLFVTDADNSSYKTPNSWELSSCKGDLKGVDITAIGIGNGNAGGNTILKTWFDDNYEWAQDKGSFDDLFKDVITSLNTSFTLMPGSDVILGGKYDDVLLGDSDIATLKSLHPALADKSVAEIFSIIQANPGAFDFTAITEPNSVPQDQTDILVGGGGNDILYGQGGDDLLIGGGKTGLDADSAIGKLAAHFSLDALTPSSSGEAISDFAESLTQSINDLATDHEKLKGFAQWATNELETVNDGNNLLFGGQGNDILIGGSGNDQLYGGVGNDILIGGSGHDQLYGGQGNDILIGGSGHDILVGGQGDNILIGGTGADVFAWWSGDLKGEDSILDFNLAEGDKLWFDGVKTEDISWAFDGANGEATSVTISNGAESKVIHLNVGNGITQDTVSEAFVAPQEDAQSAHEMVERIANDIKADTAS